MSLRILGIDPGLNITGYGVLEAADGRLRLCEAGVVRGKSRGSLTKRLVEIHEGVAEVIASLHPERDGPGGTLFALRAAADGHPDGPRPRA